MKTNTAEAAISHLYNHQTGERIREATSEELAASIAAAKQDGGHGVIQVDGLACFAV